MEDLIDQVIMDMENMNKNVTSLSKGLHTDNSPVNQPKDTYRFALNAISETQEGDITFLANEEGNIDCVSLPEDYIPIGKVYIGDNKNVIFLVSLDGTTSEIGLLDFDCNYTTLVNDGAQDDKLGFDLTKQIDAKFRLRRGCERTIYWVDPKPRFFNIDKPENFTDSSGDWDIDSFSLFTTYDSIPVFENIEIEETGNLAPGSYNAAIQYLDEDLNPTEWIVTSDVIKIYNDNLSKNYAEIRGSTNAVTNYQNFGTTNKSIKFTFSNLDLGYPFYRIAIIESNSGTGQVTAVNFSQEISTEVPVFNYTGSSSVQTEGTEAEVLAFNNIIDQAEHIEQIENRLILGNTKGKQVNFCKLQKYASRIKADLITKEIILNAISESNPKNGTVDFDGTGFMPGEIYSFGIVYIFEDGTLSPVYHIPGRNWNSTTEEGYWSQMSDDNTCENTFYTDNSTCDDYWGLDSEGDPLVSKPVRHHRFPLRSEINKPLFVEEPATEPLDLEQLRLDITGTIDGGYSADTIEYAVEYEIDGNTYFYEGTINVSTYDPDNGISIVITTSSNPITVIDIYENGSPVATPSASTDLTYATSIGNSELNVDDKVFKSEIFGIRFSGIDLPSTDDTNGEKIIGYYIVRNERDEDNKTILDTGVLAPLLEEPYFVAHGHIMPNLDDTTRIKEDAFALIHPEHRFGKREYRQTTQLIKEGEYRLLGETAVSSIRTQDVMAGTSYDPEVAKRREEDYDGFTLHTLTRDNEVRYVRAENEIISEAQLDEVFYLDSLNSRVITDVNSERKEIFNVSGDNKIAIVKTNEVIDTSEVHTKLPYMVMKRDLSDPYSNFRILNYYKQGKNRTKFILDGMGDVIAGDSVDLFSGDSYIAPMRYHNSLFYDVRLRKRASKSGFWNTFLGVISTIVGSVLAVTGVGTTVGLALVGFGVSQIATGIKKDKIARVYSELYDAGLRNAVNDNDTDEFFGPNPPDDEVQWLGDTITNLWFESSANIALRQGATVGITDFLDAPAVKVSSTEGFVTTFNLFGNTYGFVTSGTSPANELDSYMLEKLTVLDAENENGRLYQGFPNAEIYEINEDYRRINKQKIYTHLGIEYDCCSDCLEDFPHRVAYSEQSFQEELTDNYRVFLPNNYRDIEGEHGVITDLFRIQNNLYIHAEEALWYLPQNIQERVTGDIISFIGTGDFFSIPPRKIVDDEQSSAGTRHKWATVKTKYGVFFISENEGKIYKFNGENLIPISDLGRFSWFKEELPLNVNNQYYGSTQRSYPYDNNPSNPFGSGFISVYDTRNERIIFTKRDFILSDDVTSNDDYEICVNNGQLTLFTDYQATIDQYALNGYEFVGIENCRMKFSKTEYEEVIEEREIITNLPNTVDIHIFYDTSGSFGTIGGTCLGSIKDAVADWVANYALLNPDWTGTVYEYEDASERWVNYAQIIGTTTYSGQNLLTKDILVISFCNEAEDIYHDDTLDVAISSPTAQFTTDYNNFLVMHSQYKSFSGIHYPIVFGSGATACGLGGGLIPASKNFLLHSIAALKGVPMTVSETYNFSLQNPGFTPTEWQTLRTALQGTNPYPDDGLENYGWTGKWDRSAPMSGPIITAEQFQEDIQDLLEAIENIEIIEVTVQVPVTTFEYVDGVVIEEPIAFDKSWTKSFSLKDNSWTSMHSYLPNFYIQNQDKFFSYILGNDSIWEHNANNFYQTFYDVLYPHIIEYISLSEPLMTKIWNEILLQTRATRYDATYQFNVDERFTTFNKLIVYNNRQTSGLLNLRVKDTYSTDNYLRDQIVNNLDTIVIDRNERNWTINDLRDIVVDYTIPIFRKDNSSLALEYYTDKVVNADAIDYNKDWTQLESFRDKYLAVRLIFDNFDNIRLITNYSVESEQNSIR